MKKKPRLRFTFIEEEGVCFVLWSWNDRISRRSANWEGVYPQTFKLGE